MIKVLSTVLIALTLSACGGGGDGGDDGGYEPPTPYEVTYTTDSVSMLQWSSILAEGEIRHNGFFDGTISNVTQADAKLLCESLDLAGSTDWRLPNANEVDDALSRLQFSLDSLSLDNATLYKGSFHLDGKIYKAYGDYDPFRVYDAIVPVSALNFPVVQIDNTSHDFQYVATHRTVDGEVTIAPPPEVNAHVFCVRGTHTLQPVVTAGVYQDVIAKEYWGDVRQVEIQVTDIAYPGDITNVTANEITYSGLVVKDTCGNAGACIQFERVENAAFIRAGIENVKLKGEFKAFANSSAPKNVAKTGTQKLGGVGIGDIGVIIGNINHYILRPETIDKPAGTTELATDGSGKLIVYCTVGADGRLILDDSSPVTYPSGETDIDVEDHEGTGSSFNVEIIGEESDVGVLNVPESTTLYNFKTIVSHGKDYIYFGYNDGETPVSYTKDLSICNTGTVDISGTSFVIEPDAADAALVRSFSHDYSGSAVGFAQGECKTYTINMAFNRPLLDDDVKIKVTINDNFNSLTWDDYTAFKLSQYEPLPLYFAADSTATFTGNGLQGLLIAPGRQLLRVNFTSFAANNFIRVPRKLDDEYQLILATTNIADESAYMISTDQVPNTTLMDAFTNVTINEPDNTFVDATIVPLLSGEEVGYLHTGDVDFYRLMQVQ